MEFISSAITHHTNDEDAALSVEYSSTYIGEVKRSQKQIVTFFQSYSVNALTRSMKEDVCNRITNKIIRDHLKLDGSVVS